MSRDYHNLAEVLLGSKVKMPALILRLLKEISRIEGFSHRIFISGIASQVAIIF